MIFYPVLFTPQRKIRRAVNMPKYRFIYAVFFKQLGKERIFVFQGKGRIMYHRDFLVPLFIQPVRFRKRKLKPLRFTQIQLLVLLGKIGTSRTRPPTRADDNELSYLDGVRL